jgi:hypothetical protein
MLIELTLLAELLFFTALGFCLTWLAWQPDWN